MKDYQRPYVNTTGLGAFSIKLQASGPVLLTLECGQDVTCNNDGNGSFTSGGCSLNAAGGQFFVPGQTEFSPVPTCRITANNVTSSPCDVSFDHSCSEGAFLRIDCVADYNCAEGEQITIQCEGYAPDQCQIIE